MKRFLIWAGILASLLGPANAAGTVPGFSLTPQFDSLGKVMPGCKLYVIQAGTTQTPQNSYQDSALTILQPNPLLCDATGRLPQWFVADGQIKVRLTNTNGIQQFVGDNLLVVGASSGGGGGGGTVDPTTIIATGDVKARYGTGVLTGFVRANGRTIGSATSGATERANADAQALFEYLWQTDANLVVSTGRGASANADWVANKTIALPDWRGRVIGGLDDMGAPAAGRLTAAGFGAVGTTLGLSGGSETQSLTSSQIPNITSSRANTITVNSNATNIIVSGNIRNNLGEGTGNPFAAFQNSTVGSGQQTSAGANTITVDSISTGGSNPVHPNMQPTMLATIYLKL